MIPNLQDSGRAPQRVVIDTNVCVDLFVFHDARWAPLRAAIEDGSVMALTRDDCRREYRYVLHYPHLPLDEASRAQAQQDFDRLLHCLPAADFVPPEMRLPVCKDREDQKFLEAAWQAQAAVLISKDKALLKLDKRNGKLGYFRILTPEAWVKAWEAQPAALG